MTPPVWGEYSHRAWSRVDRLGSSLSRHRVPSSLVLWSSPSIHILLLADPGVHQVPAAHARPSWASPRPGMTNGCIVVINTNLSRFVYLGSLGSPGHHPCARSPGVHQRSPEV